MRKLCLDSGERDLLLIYLKREIGRILVIIGVLHVVGKLFCKILNNRLVECLDREGMLHEGQAGFRVNRSCVDNIFTLNELVQGRIREDKRLLLFS